LPPSPLGALLGYLAQSGLAWLLRDLIRTELPDASLAPLPIALVTVTGHADRFALPPLLQLKNTPPARVLRKTVTAPPLRFGSLTCCAVGALFAILWSLVRDTELVVERLAGVLAVGVVLTAAGYGLVRLTGRLRGGVGLRGATVWRMSRAAGAAAWCKSSPSAWASWCCCCLAVVRGDLLADWRRSLPTNAPNNFLINIRPDERASLEEFLKSHGLGQPRCTPWCARA
jgi:putative ABC transport system permease protein